MIANIFFNSTMDHNNESIYTESYLNYLLTEIMYEKETLNILYKLSEELVISSEIIFKKVVDELEDNNVI